MSTCLPFGPLLSFSPIQRFQFRTRTSQFQSPFFHRTHLSGASISRTPLPGTVTVAKFGLLGSGQLPDPESSEGFFRELLGKAEGFFYTIADAAVSNSEAVDSSAKQSNDWLSGITSYMETVLKVLKDGLSELHVPYAYGFAIILLTVIVKAATFPLTKKQVESAMAMRSLQPQIKAIQERYAGDQERIQLEIARIYKLAGINPLAGCLPTLATIPIWIGLYRALSNVANEGLLTEGFFWIPSLAGPTTIAARQNGSGISWLFPFVDGHPPLGWSDTFAYLVLPVLLVVSQYLSVQIMQTSQVNDPNMKTSQTITKFLPLLIGYFALSVPSGLSLYWLTNNILSTAQQVWLQKLGGAKNPLGNISQDTLKEEKPQIEKPVMEIKSTQTEEVSPSTGLHRGERFKQLKEEEERRRRQREEERRRAEEIASNAVSMIDEEEEDTKLTKDGNSHPVEMIDGENGKNMKANNNRAAMNGDTTISAFREHQSTSIPVEENSRQTDDAGGRDNKITEGSSGRDNQVAEGSSVKEVAEVTSGSSSMENRFQGEEKSGQD